MPAFLLRRASLLLWLAGLLPLLAAGQASPTFDMARRVLQPLNGPGSGSFNAVDLAVDRAGNSYICGGFIGGIRFGTTSIPAGTADSYVACLDAAGNPRWITTFTTQSNNLSLVNDNHLVVAPSGNILVAGSFTTPTIRFGNATLTNAGQSDVFVASLDPAGNWVTAVRGGGPGSERVTGLALDGSGNLYLSGTFVGQARFGSTQFTTTGSSDMFVARLDGGGSWRWATAGGSPYEAWSIDLAVDARGHVFLLGYLSTRGGSFGPLTFPAFTNILGRLDAATGAVQQVEALGGLPSPGNALFPYRLVADAGGSCQVAGVFVGQVRFGPHTLFSTSPTMTGDHLFVARRTAAGAWQWAVTADSRGAETCLGLAVDAQANSYLTGNFRGGSLRFGSTTLPAPNTPASELYVAKLDSSGRWQWAVAATGRGDKQSTRLALGPANAPYITGISASPRLQFGPITLPGPPDSSAFTFVARLQPAQLSISGDSVLCAGNAIQLTASTLATATGIGYLWSTGATTPSIRVTQPGTYAVTVTFPGGYTLSQSFRVRGLSASVQISGNTGPLCPGSTRQLTALAPGALSYLWSTGATTASIGVTQPGTYSVQATYGPACVVTAQVSIAANSLSTAGRLQLCPGQSTTLTAVAAGGPVASYQWSTGATTPTLLVSQAGSYTVTAQFADGCQLSATHTVGPPVARVASVSGDTLLCPGTTLSLTALNPDALTYRWNTGATTPGIQISQPGLYAVLLTYAGGCTSRDSLLVEAAPLAPAFSLGPDTTLCLEQPLLLRAPVLSGPGLRYRWPDGSTASTFTVTEPGTYSLLITSLCDSRTVTRRVAYQSCLQLPNVITPNGDGRNDYLAFPGLTRGDWELTIFNRWGRQVYHSPAYRHDWGATAAPGVYYYLLRQGTSSYKSTLEVVR